MLTKAAFLDRDDTLIKSHGNRAARSPDEMILFPSVPHGLRILKNAGFLLVVVSNQGGIAKGFLTNETMVLMNAKLNDLILAAKGPEIDAFYWCPHYPSISACKCRKPQPGMILQASKDLVIDLENSIMVGDHETDMEAAKAAGISKLFLLLSARSSLTNKEKLGYTVVRTFKEAVVLAAEI